MTYLRLGRGVLIVAVGGGAQRGTRPIVASSNASSLCQVFLALGFSDFDLLFFATTSQLLGLERVLRLELGAAVLGDVPLSHGDGRMRIVGGW